VTGEDRDRRRDAETQSDERKESGNEGKEQEAQRHRERREI